VETEDPDWGLKIYTGQVANAYLSTRGLIPGCCWVIWRDGHVCEPTDPDPADGQRFFAEGDPSPDAHRPGADSTASGALAARTSVVAGGGDVGLDGVPQYVLARRLEVALSMLASPAAGSATIAEVARRCGFASTAYFSNAFRSRCGVRATDTRRRALTEGALRPR
jgi:AraC-like DNA-binding protein